MKPSSASAVPGPGRVAPLPRDELEKACSRDPAALGAFFDRYFDLIFGLACRLTGNRTHAEDVCQEVFLRVRRGLPRFDPSRDPAPWLTTIVGNACREFWRGKHYRAARRSVPLTDLADWEADHPRSEKTPESTLLQSEKHQRVRQAVLDLPAPLREVVLLHDFQEMTHREIAEATGTSHAAIRKRHSRALARLAATLKGEDS